MSVPCGMSQGLPVGMMLVGAALQRVDDLSRRARVRAARRLAQLLTRRADVSANPFRSDWLDGSAADDGCGRRARCRTCRARPTSRCASSRSRSCSTRRCAATARATRRSSTPTGVRLSWYDLQAQRRRGRGGPAGARACGAATASASGRRTATSGWSLQFGTARIGADPRQHQPGLPRDRARVRAATRSAAACW